MRQFLTARARGFALGLFASTTIFVAHDAGARPPDCLPNARAAGCTPVPEPTEPFDYTSTGGYVGSYPASPRPGTFPRLTANVTVRIQGPGVSPITMRPTAGDWAFVVRPPDSTAGMAVPTDVSEADKPLQRFIGIDKPGHYEVSFTACPSGCSYRVSNRTFTEPASTFRIVFDVPNLPELDLTPQLPPLTSVPPRRYPAADAICLDGFQGATQPQWALTSYWSNPSSYVFLEGTARSSRPSGEDNFLNHHTNDFKMTVGADEPFRYLLNADDDKNVDGTNERIEVEWEQGELPEPFRPMNGDRVSVYGYHAFDCGHGHSTEIHPPVMIATHRQRMIPVPADQPFYLDRAATTTSTVGTNVWVGGVLTDVFISGHGGEATDNCSLTGLHQPGVAVCGVPLPPPQTGTTCGLARGACIQGPSPIRRRFDFNVYLPPNPAYLEGRTGEEAPLYFASYAHPSFGAASSPQPTITPVRVGDRITYLKVSVDLTNFTGTKWAQQIVAGWVLPDQANHGMESWRVRADALTVHDDSEPIPFDDGDWRVSLAIPNHTKAWTRIIDCNGCIDEGETITPTSSNWVSGSTTADGTLFGDLRVLPQQDVRLRAYGYDDEVLGDDLGSINVPLGPNFAAFTRTVRAVRSGNASGHYSLRFTTLPGAPVPPAALTPAAEALRERFLFVSNGAARSRRPAPPVADLDEAEENEGEPLVAGALTATKLRALAAVNPAAVSALVVEARTHVNALLSTKSRAKVERKVAPLRDAVPAALWNAHFADLFPKT